MAKEEKDKKKKQINSLKERIKQTGYPLEIYISTLLDKEYGVYNTYYYPDAETRKGRSIDIFAIPAFSIPNKPTKVVPARSMAIECKKSETHPWVFFTRDSSYGNLNGYQDISGQCKSSIPHVLFPNSSSSDDWIRNALFTSMHYCSFERVAIAYTELQEQSRTRESKSKGPKQIFGASIQLSKFTSFLIHQTISKFLKTIDKENIDLIPIVLPVIVFDGKMFEAYNIKDELCLQPRNHILLRNSFLCPYCRRIENFLFDVVQANYFEKFLQILRKDFDAIEETLYKNQEDIQIGSKREKAKLKKMKHKPGIDFLK